jgi:hypothetical protein
VYQSAMLWLFKTGLFVWGSRHLISRVCSVREIMDRYEATKIWSEERVTIAATVLQVCSFAQNTWNGVLEDRRGCSRVAICDDLTSDVSRTRFQGWLLDAVNPRSAEFFVRTQEVLAARPDHGLIQRLDDSC